MEKYNFGEDEDYLVKYNILGIENLHDLERAEQYVFMVRSLEIEQGHFQFERFDWNTLLALHHYLFQDIYQFAGQVRNVQLAKGTTRFCQAQHISRMAEQLFREMQNEPKWQSIKEAAERLAYFKSELNMIHPFREGNGRTTRLFINAYAKKQGFFWNYAALDQAEYMEAMIQSVLNTEQLVSMFQKTLSKI